MLDRNASLIVAALALCGPGPARGQDDAKRILLSAKRDVVNTLDRLPRYVCTQTIARSRYGPESARYVPDGKHRGHSCDEVTADASSPKWKRRLMSTDRLRLDVAVTRSRDGQATEMYSWAGDDQFRHGDLFDFVRDGAVSTGSFSALLASIFGNDSASFSYNGDHAATGKLLSEFGFRVPFEKSRYTYLVRNGGEQQVAMAYSGTLLVDPEAAELKRLVVRTNHLPEESGACELTQTLDYSRAMLRGTDFLLPAAARVSLIRADGTEAVNEIQYSACHEFQGESNVRFDLPEADVPEARRPAPAAALALPAGLPFKLAFTERIDSGSAAAGDVVTGKLRTAIRDRSSKVLVAEGAAVTARIVSITHYYEHPLPEMRGRTFEADHKRPALVIKIKLESVEAGGMTYPLAAKFDSGYGRYLKATAGLSPRIEIGTLDGPEDTDEGIFPFWSATPNYIVARGLESNWLTAGP